MAMDERMAIVTRIADALGIATQTRKTRTKRPALKQAFKQAEDAINAALGNLMKDAAAIASPIVR
jgi:hypothetical protein